MANWLDVLKVGVAFADGFLRGYAGATGSLDNDNDNDDDNDFDE